MKHLKVITCLLLFILLFTSCTTAKKYFEEGNYTKALKLLNEKSGLNKDEYLMKAQCYVNLGRKEEAKESIMLYLLMSEETDDRSYAVNLYTDMEFSDILNVLLLNENDGLKAQVLRYKSYASLGEFEKAKDILTNYLSSELTLEQFATLLVAYPINDDYIFSFFDAWYKIINESEKTSFFSLFIYFTRQNISENVAKDCFKLSNSFDKDPYFTSSKINLAILYKTKGYLCEKLHDTYNAKIFWQNSYLLNPKDTEIKNLIK